MDRGSRRKAFYYPFLLSHLMRITIPAETVEHYRKAAAADRFAAWIKFLEQYATPKDGGWLIPLVHYQLGLGSYPRTGKFTPLKIVPFSAWPLWARTVRRVSNSTDKGVGDTLHRLAGVIGWLWKVMSLKLLGRPCGCIKRAEKFNYMYPYQTG